jgi:DNA polymerase IV
VKFSDFELITRNRSCAVIATASDLSSLALDLPKHLMPPKKTMRLLGISVSGFRARAGDEDRLSLISVE